MAITLAFDVYGTLIDTQGVLEKLTVMVGDKAPAFSKLWRDKQLEYAFRRGLMQHYVDFAVCTRDALNYTDQVLQSHLSEADKSALLATYRVLPAFSDVVPALEILKSSECKLYAFSNGRAEAVEGLLQQAHIQHFFHGVVSVDDLKSFKPNPAVYAHLLRVTASAHHQTWLVSSNPFDVIGAISAGLQAAWVQRTPESVFDPWGIEPTTVATDLVSLAKQLAPS